MTGSARSSAAASVRWFQVQVPARSVATRHPDRLRIDEHRPEAEARGDPRQCVGDPLTAHADSLRGQQPEVAWTVGVRHHEQGQRHGMPGPCAHERSTGHERMGDRRCGVVPAARSAAKLSWNCGHDCDRPEVAATGPELAGHWAARGGRRSVDRSGSHRRAKKPSTPVVPVRQSAPRRTATGRRQAVAWLQRIVDVEPQGRAPDDDRMADEQGQVLVADVAERVDGPQGGVDQSQQRGERALSRPHPAASATPQVSERVGERAEGGSVSSRLGGRPAGEWQPGGVVPDARPLPSASRSAGSRRARAGDVEELERAVEMVGQHEPADRRASLADLIERGGVVVGRDRRRRSAAARAARGGEARRRARPRRPPGHRRRCAPWWRRRSAGLARARTEQVDDLPEAVDEPQADRPVDARRSRPWHPGRAWARGGSRGPPTNWPAGLAAQCGVDAVERAGKHVHAAQRGYHLRRDRSCRSSVTAVAGVRARRPSMGAVAVEQGPPGRARRRCCRPARRPRSADGGQLDRRRPAAAAAWATPAGEQGAPGDRRCRRPGWRRVDAGVVGGEVDLAQRPVGERRPRTGTTSTVPVEVPRRPRDRPAG